MDQIICPITLCTMVNPVIDHEGNSYEEEAITRWVQQHGKSPLTNSPLSLSQLKPNRALKNIIDSHSSNNTPPVPVPRVEINETDLSITMNHLVPENQYHIQINPVDSTESTYSHITLGLDTSGSMMAAAKTQNEGGESTGLSMLDIVRYASKTIVESLGPNDYLSIIDYNTNATILMNYKPMTTDNKTRANTILDGLRTSGQTNIWDCLHQGLELNKGISNPYQNNMFILLTDGEETIKPPRGTKHMLDRYKQQFGEQNCNITTCLFGYNADLELMEYISNQYNGNTLFIPDSGSVGTNFINLTSNVLSTKAVKTKLMIEFNPATTKINTESLDRKYDYNLQENQLEINIGNVRYGQSRDILLGIDSQNQDFKVSVSYIDVKKHQETQINETYINSLTTSNTEMSNQIIRCNFIDTLYKILDFINLNGLDDTLKEFITQMINSFHPTNLYQTNIMKDLKEQVSLSVSRMDWWRRWGKPYIKNLIKSNIFQECSNFKDHSLQLYGGELFNQLRDTIDDIFGKLPHPTPSLNIRNYNTNTTTRAPINMNQVFNNAAGGCFTGKSRVKMYNNTFKDVSQLVKNDKVVTPNGEAMVECIIKTNIPNNISIDFVEMGDGLEITPYHPVKTDEWRFPIDLASIKSIKCPAMYNVVLNTGHIMIINGIQCCTLGHNFQDNSVISHPYLGTHRVIDDLKQMIGWDEGLIELQHNCLVRDNETNLISKLVQL